MAKRRRKSRHGAERTAFGQSVPKRVFDYSPSIDTAVGAFAANLFAWYAANVGAKVARQKAREAENEKAAAALFQKLGIAVDRRERRCEGCGKPFELVDEHDESTLCESCFRDKKSDSDGFGS